MKNKGVSPLIGTVLLIAIVVALAAVVATLVSGVGGRGTETPDYWMKAYPVGTHLPVGDESNVQKFIDFRLTAYDEIWEQDIFTCSYGWFVERVK